MLRVFYPYVAMPEKPKIALELRDRLGWDPVLWIAPSNQLNEVLGLFPDIATQTIADAFFGRPIPGVSTSTPPVPEAALLRRLQAQLAPMMSMMNYYGPPDAFLFSERERFARNLLLHWNEVLAVLKPDIVFFEEAPHAPHTWALYSLCLEYGIPTPFFMPTAVPTFSVLKDRVDGPPLRVAECVNGDVELEDVHSDVLKAVRSVTDADTFAHWYMEQQAAADDAAEGTAQILKLGPSPLSAIPKLAKIWKWPAYAKRVAELATARMNPAPAGHDEALDQTSEWILLKFPGLPLGDPQYTLRDYAVYSDASARRKEVLKRDYLERCVEPDMGGEPFVYFALHYQPERTTDSDGGIFRDQFLAIAMLHEALPEGWLLYVKEHPSQFTATLHGDKGRTKEFYDDLQRLPRVRLVRPDYSSKALTMGSKCVATITGTLAWEAVFNGKPALTFGYTWYSGCPGVFEVESAPQAAAAFEAVDRGATPTSDELDLYLRVFTTAAYRVDLNAWVREEPEVTEPEQVAGMLAAMAWWMSARFERART